eukprot:scaffold221469_cov14-Tisochrysis_lutea.AAC.1
MASLHGVHETRWFQCHLGINAKSCRPLLALSGTCRPSCRQTCERFHGVPRAQTIMRPLLPCQSQGIGIGI